MNNQTFLTYKGCNYLRQRLILSSLSGKPVKITNIRDKDEAPGLKEFEGSFIRLINRLSNGSKIEINVTGTEVKFFPGILCGEKFEHNCHPTRGIGYYLEHLLIIAPFMKTPLDITFRGVTNNNLDPSIDQIIYSMIPVLSKFLENNDGLVLKILKRGFVPSGNGIVHFKCPTKKDLKAVQWFDMGKIKKIRGVAYASRVAPNVPFRMLESAKSVLKDYLKDIYITCDNSKCASPGTGLCLVAETNKGSYFSAEISRVKGDESIMMDNDEDIGEKVAYALLEEIYIGGCVDTLTQPLILAFMVLAPQDVSKVVLGPLPDYSIAFCKHIKDFFGVTFKIDMYKQKSITVDEDDKELKLGAPKVTFTCVGTGYKNIGKMML